ncbi:MAG: NAD-dependent epimerase [Muribaculaceae bacterium]|nr:NAD-dependent epimerase [Muribaculaceae bacterium]
MNILVTGAAGFIGSHLILRLLQDNHNVTGLDNINDYYDQRLKIARLRNCGIECPDEPEIPDGKFYEAKSATGKYRFIRMSLEDTDAIAELFSEGQFDVVVNLAAQAGVRYSITHPRDYVQSNVVGFLNILEGCRDNKVKHLVYASSSSVYGLNGEVPFSEHHGIAHPVSLYAATKKSNELMAHVYSHLYNIPTTGLRFFTVYGPWGRPDMSPFLFIDAIMNDREIKVFNNGNMLRDFTYIDDIVEGIVRIIDIIPEGNANWDSQAPDPATSTAPYRIFNIGNSQPTNLMDYINCIEKSLGKDARKQMLPMQPGDVYQTYADSSALAEITGFKPDTPLQSGIDRTVEWFKAFYKGSE